MIDISFNLTEGVARLSRTMTIKPGGDVPVRVTFNATPSGLESLQFALGSDAATPAVLAFTEDFDAESETIYTATLDANDARLIDFMEGKQSTQVNGEITLVIDGETIISPNLPVGVQQRILTVPGSTVSGPLYYTQAQVDGLFAALQPAVTLAGDQTISGTKNFTGALQIDGEAFDGRSRHLYDTDTGLTPILTGGLVIESGTFVWNVSGAAEFREAIGAASAGDFVSSGFTLTGQGLLGHANEGGGAAQEIGLGAGLAFDGGVLVNSGVSYLAGNEIDVFISNDAPGYFSITLAQSIAITSAPQFANVRITHSSLGHGWPTDLDLAGDGFQTVQISGDISFSASNFGEGRSKTVRIIGDGSDRALYFPSQWKFVGAAPPTQLPANKSAILTVTSFGSWDGDIVAAYAQEP